ncbi:MAG: metal ABC transporter permease [Chloroflexi bacterium]|nr:MAG: metal ABC transporter permease [Chloroflexota bacterium]
MIDWIVEPYTFAFMQRALIALTLVSIVGGVVGAFVVHKGLAFSGDALAHSTLAGVAVAFASGGNVSLGALVAAIVTAVGIGWTRERARVSYDTAIGITFVAMFAFGILLISRRTSYTPDLFSFVFGNILGVSSSDLVGAAILAAVLLLFVAATYREQLLVAYDPAMASAAGVATRAFQYAMLVMIAVAVVVALKAIGIVLVNAMLIIPAATASLVVRRLPTIMLLAVGFAMAASLAGLQISFHANVAASAAIVLVAAAMFLVTLGLVTWTRRPSGVA